VSKENLMDEKTKEFYREIRLARDKFVDEVKSICIKYGMDIVPFPELEIIEFWKSRLDKIIDKDFRTKIERRIKSLKKELNPVWRRIRGWFGK